MPNAILKIALLLLLVSCCLPSRAAQLSDPPPSKVELFKSNGKPIYVDDGDYFTIVLNDSVDDQLKTTTSTTYEGYLLQKSDQSLTFHVLSFEQQIQKHDRLVQRSFEPVTDSLEIIQEIRLDNIDFVSRQTNVGGMCVLTGTLACLTAVFVAPLVSFNYRNGTFNSNRYLNIMKFSLPTAAVSLGIYYAFGSRTFHITP